MSRFRDAQVGTKLSLAFGALISLSSLISGFFLWHECALSLTLDGVEQRAVARFVLLGAGILFAQIVLMVGLAVVSVRAIVPRL